MTAIGKRQNIDLTSGSLLGKIILFMLPLVFTNLLQVFYSAADMMVVAASSEPDAVGAIGTSNHVINMIVNTLMCLSAGTSIVVARHIGARNERGASRAVHTSLLLSLIIGICSMVAGLIFSRAILVAMGATGKLLTLGTTYTKIYFLGVPFVALTNFEISIFRAKGDAQTPFLVLTGAGLLNLVLNLFFVFVCHLTVDGVAAATAIANAASALVLLFFLARSEDACRFSLRALCLDGRELRDILIIGIPAGLQQVLSAISNMMIQSSILEVNNIMCPPDATYQPVVKASTAVGSLEGFISTALNSVALAAISAVGQNVGAGNYRRVRRTMWLCGLLSFLLACGGFGIMYFLRRPLLALYGIKEIAGDPLSLIAMEAATTRILILSTALTILGFEAVGQHTLRGLGYSTTTTVIYFLTNFLFRILWLTLVFPLSPTLENVFICYPITYALDGSLFYIISSRILRRRIREQDRLAAGSVPQPSKV